LTFIINLTVLPKLYKLLKLSLFVGFPSNENVYGQQENITGTHPYRKLIFKSNFQTSRIVESIKRAGHAETKKKRIDDSLDSRHIG